MSRPRLVTDPERELRLLRYDRIAKRRNAKLVGMGVVAVAMEVAAVLLVRSGASLSIVLFLAASVVMLLTLILDDFLP